MWKLQVFVRENCWNCVEARRIVALLKQQFPHICFELLDVDDISPPEQVFATPTYLLNGVIFQLGNPTLALLQATLRSLSLSYPAGIYSMMEEQ
jgi:alkyl hydroperoxide reductase subunit AhpF